MEPIIEIRKLGKQFALASKMPYMSLREWISGSVKNMTATRHQQKFWALKDIDLDVKAGERIGIIGRNGAGKSTLLKIISRITPPTTGEATIRGRVGSLLEVGTGFHPELTGRENIFLNGSILGLKKTEIKKQFDEIVEFSGVQQFIDTPLKFFSSGMQLRLAFSVAAHLDPEILLIDEVLAVGDIDFQRKCIGKMEEVSKKQGRTILFVSHNMDSIRKFCPTTILLHEGQIISQGNTEQVISEYVSKHLQTKTEMNWPEGISSHNQEVNLKRAFLHNAAGRPNSRFDTTEKIGVTLEYEVMKEDAVFTHGINVYNQENMNIFNSHDVTSPLRAEKRKKGNYKATAWIPGHLLPEGLFTVGVALFLPNPVDILVHEQEALVFEIFTDFSKHSARGNYADEFPGVVRPLIQWEAVKTS